MLDEDKARDNKGPTLRARDVEDTDPLRVLIDKHKDLKLTDEQLTALKGAEDKVKDTNKPLLAIVDSVTREMRGAASDDTPSGQERMNASRIGLMTALREIANNYDEAAKGAITTWSADQQKQATDLVDKKREDSQRALRERLGGGRS
jgi:hypothetical protein